MDNKNVFIAIALSMSVLLFWAAFFETPKPVNNNIPQQKKTNENTITPNIICNVEGTEITQSLTLDLDGNGNTGNIEVSTRLMDSLRITADYNFYWSLKSSDTLYSFRRDNYFGIKVTNYF